MTASKILTATVLGVLLSALLFFTGCKKDSNSNTLTADDAADAVTYATSSSTGGMAAEITTAATYSYSQGFYKTNGNAAILSLTCSVPFDTSVAYTYTGTTTASYTSQWDYLLACTGTVPQSLTLSGSYTGNYNAPHIESSNSGSRNWIVSGLDVTTSTPYTFNGTFNRTGSHTSKVRNQYTYTVNMTITVTNLTVSKTTGLITGGTGTVNMTGNVTNGNSYSFNGNIIFNGGGTATLTINGNVYSIAL